MPANTPDALPALSGARNGVLVARERLGAQPDVVVGDQVGRRFVHEVAVLDVLHAGGDRPLDRGRRVGVHRDVGLPVSAVSTAARSSGSS